jgi:hypothetical protein
MPRALIFYATPRVPVPFAGLALHAVDDPTDDHFPLERPPNTLGNVDGGSLNTRRAPSALNSPVVLMGGPDRGACTRDRRGRRCDEPC